MVDRLYIATGGGRDYRLFVRMLRCTISALTATVCLMSIVEASLVDYVIDTLDVMMEP